MSVRRKENLPLRCVRSLPRSSRSPLRAITYAIVMQLTQAGFSENQLAEGNGEALTTYSDQLVINELIGVGRQVTADDRFGGDGLDEPQYGRLADLLLCGSCRRPARDGARLLFHRLPRAEGVVLG